MAWLRRIVATVDRRVLRRWVIVGYVDAADEVPEDLAPRGAIVVGTASQPRWIGFDCPCVDAHRLLVNLDPSRRPTWRLRAGRRMTLAPSIDDRSGNRRCHFTVTNGAIHWARNSTSTPSSGVRRS